MADKNNPFGGYNEKNVGRTVQNVTSSMWEPISAGPSVKKDTPVKKNSAQSKGKAPEGKKAPSSKKTQGKKKTTTDVTRDRISEGGDAPKKKTKSNASTKAPQKKKSSTAKKRPSQEKNRQPKGKDTRNPDSKQEQARLQKERKKAREHARSQEKARQKSRDGISYDEMRNSKTRSTRLKAKIVAVATVMVVLLTVICCICVYAYHKGAPVAFINVTGESPYKNEKIIEAANVYTGINMLSVREKTVNRLVTKTLPYIKQVQVDYQFPDTLVLNVTSTKEQLLISGEGGYICLDKDSKVLSLKKKKLTEGQYLVQGLEAQEAVEGEQFIPTQGNKEKYERARAIASALEKTGKLTTGVIDVTELGNVTLLYDSRINIYLGDCSRLENQLEFAVSIIETDEDIINGQSGYIETRFEGQATFKPGGIKK